MGDELLFACARYDGEGPRGRLQAVRVDPRDGAVEIRGSVPFEDPVETPVEDQSEYARPYLAGFPDGRALLHFTFYRYNRTDAYLATSRDGGRTWDAVVDAAVLLKSGGREVDLVHASGPAGSTHLWALVSDATATDVHHVVLDAVGNVTHRRQLATGLRAPTVPPDDALKGFVYEGGGLAWAAGAGLLAWEHPHEEGALRVLHLAVHRPTG